MKSTIIAAAFAAFTVAAIADGQHRNNSLQPQHANAATQQLADSFEWRRSRPGGGDQEPAHESSNYLA